MVSRTPVNGLFSGRDGRLLLTGAIGWGVIQGGRRFIPPLLPSIISTFDITPVQAGMVLSAMYVAYAVGQYPSGQLSDRLSRGTLIAPGLAVIVAGYVLFAASPSYLVLVIASATIGLGRAAYSIPIRVLVSERFTDRRGQAISVIASVSDVGGVVAAGGAILVLATTTWRLPFAVVGVVLVGVLASFLTYYEGGYSFEWAPLHVREALVRVVGDADLRPFLGSYFLFRFTVAGAIDFLPLFLHETKGFSPTAASAGFALIYIAGSLGKPVAGALSDRIPRTLVSAGSLTTGVVALVLLVLVDSTLAVAAAIALYGLGYKTVFPVMDAFFLEQAGSDDGGADLGVIRSLGTAAGAVAPLFVGYVGQVFTYSVAFGGLAFALFVGTASHVVGSRGG
ncbi:MAG: MFS transporter [Halanaeroarchaeum sp.]